MYNLIVKKKGENKMTYDIYSKALAMLKSREEYWGNEAHKDGIGYATQSTCLARAGAYNSAWWILRYAMDENWESLDQMDYYDGMEGE